MILNEVKPNGNFEHGGPFSRGQYLKEITYFQWPIIEWTMENKGIFEIKWEWGK
jgi:hypothetical protein